MLQGIKPRKHTALLLLVPWISGYMAINSRAQRMVVEVVSVPAKNRSRVHNTRLSPQKSLPLGFRKSSVSAMWKARTSSKIRLSPAPRVLPEAARTLHPHPHPSNRCAKLMSIQSSQTDTAAAQVGNLICFSAFLISNPHCGRAFKVLSLTPEKKRWPCKSAHCLCWGQGAVPGSLSSHRR